MLFLACWQEAPEGCLIALNRSPADRWYYIESCHSLACAKSTHLGKLGDRKGWQVLCSDIYGPSLLHCSVAVPLMQATGARGSSKSPVAASLHQRSKDESSTNILKTRAHNV